MIFCTTLPHFSYSPSTGTFTANAEGLYYFSIYAEFDHDSKGELHINKNGITQCTARGEGGTDTLEEATSCSAVIQLQPRDEVNVKTSVANPFENAKRNGFTGFRI